MTAEELDDREFTDEQMHAALRRVGEAARREAFAAGLPVYIMEDGAIVAVHGDGREEIVKVIHPKNGKAE